MFRIRTIAVLLGLGVAFVLALGVWNTIDLWVKEPPQETADHAFHKHPEPLELASDGIFGRFDNRQLQRGFQVFKEVCSSCHSLSLVSFRNLEQIGYSEDEVKAIAKQWGEGKPGLKQPAQDPKAGTWGERDNLPADRFPKVYYPGAGNPPDLSLIAKARHGGAAYIHSLLTGYGQPQPAELLEHFPEKKTEEGSYYNPYFAGLNIAMPPPFTGEGQVQYTDGTRATVDQMSKDVSAFLVWTAEPTLQKRHQVGIAVILFLLITTVLAYGAYLTVWRGVKH